MLPLRLIRSDCSALNPPKEMEGLIRFSSHLDLVQTSGVTVSGHSSPNEAVD